MTSSPNNSLLSLTEIIIRTVAAVLIGWVIGSERSAHGRAAGPRTHILVCLGACMTSMTSMFVYQAGVAGDVFRISAQVISGIGFLGAGMIIVRNDSTVTGLTTAAGIWVTGAIGVALGYGYYIGVLVVTLIVVATLTVLSLFERKKNSAASLYLELGDMSRANEVFDYLKELASGQCKLTAGPPASGAGGHLGVTLRYDKRRNPDLTDRISHPAVVYFLLL